MRLNFQNIHFFTEEASKLPYFVHRNKFHNMPVYLLKKGPLERTKILKVDGDIQVTLKPMLSFEKIALSPFT